MVNLPLFSSIVALAASSDYFLKQLHINIIQALAWIKDGGIHLEHLPGYFKARTGLLCKL